jgi:hypothetical protein
MWAGAWLGIEARWVGLTQKQVIRMDQVENIGSGWDDPFLAETLFVASPSAKNEQFIIIDAT